MRRVLICGSPDLNYIDGSSIWAQTIALATAATGVADVDFLTKSKPERDELFAPLRAAQNLNILDGTDPGFWAGKTPRRLTLPMMAQLTIMLDSAKPYDVIIVRGLEIANTLLGGSGVLSKCWIYLTDIPQRLTDCSIDLRQTLQEIAKSCCLLLCQTEGFKVLWRSLAPGIDHSKLRLYTPVIPDLPTSVTQISARPVRAIYAGKFAGEWMTLEMVEQWHAVHRQLLDSELVMIGDKIHNEPDRPDYLQRMRHALETTPGLRWLGAQSREEVQQQLHQARIGLSWRAETMNDTVEYSTKILEYGGAGCAAILNRNPLHEQLLGRDYPLFANSDHEFAAQLTRALRDSTVAQEAANVLRRLAQRHTFSSRVNEIRQWLAETPRMSTTKGKARVLIAGHDLKFLMLLQQKLQATGHFDFLVDQWQGHNKHDETRSRSLLDRADVIVCEWCLGNLKWYSHHRRPHQRLVARFHAQEVRSNYLAESDWSNIDHIVFVSEHTRRQALEVFRGFPIGKTSVIPNYLDDTKFTPKKKTGDARHTLGMVGVTPKSKRLDRAVDLLELLLATDRRYCLRVKGKHPLEYPWLLNRADELFYYRGVFQRINGSAALRHRVIFDPAGNDVNDWFTMVGFILSPSDNESFHMAIGEGMLTGATPVIWNWEGADQIWGSQWVVTDTPEAAARVTQFNATSPATTASAFPAQLNPHNVLDQWLHIISRS